MEKLRLVKTKTVKDYQLTEDAFKDLITNNTQEPKFSSQSKENERNFLRLD